MKGFNKRIVIENKSIEFLNKRYILRTKAAKFSSLFLSN